MNRAVRIFQITTAEICCQTECFVLLLWFHTTTCFLSRFYAQKYLYNDLYNSLLEQFYVVVDGQRFIFVDEGE